jgi:hypothetical protein
MLSGQRPGSEQQQISKAFFLRQFCPAAWALVKTAGQANV